ncbi:MAG: N-formylglutamate amidohydrolase [Aliidongia sp.]
MREGEAGRAESGLLAPEDPAPFIVVDPDGRPDLLLVCDHAGAAVPAALDRLGLDDSALARHIGWDIGAAAVTHLLARRLGAPAVLSGYSRLVIDCNRTLDDPTSIPMISDGQVVPGNQELSATEKQARAEACFWPYHRAIEAQLERATALGAAPAMISMHSFTPWMNGFARPWHIGILWERDPRIPVPLLAGLAARPGLVVGDNQPYSGHDPEGYTLRQHAIPRGLPHVLIELRQDEIGTVAGVERFAEHLAAALQPILADPELFRAAVYL